MSRLEVVKSIAKDLGLNFHYGDLNDANLGVAKFQTEDYPILLYVAPVKEKNTQESTGLILKDVNFFAYILFSRASVEQSDATISYDYEEVDVIVERARSIAKVFKLKLEKSAISQPKGIEEWETNGVYGFTDQHLFGCDFIIQAWPIQETCFRNI